MFDVITLERENDLNKTIRSHRQAKEPFGVLYYSLWDEYSLELVREVYNKNCGAFDDDIKLYLVDTFNMPHSTIIFKDNKGDNISKLPALVIVDDMGIQVVDYLPHIYENLALLV